MQVLTFREKAGLSWKEQVSYNKALKQHKKDKANGMFIGKSVFMITLMNIVTTMFVGLVMVGLPLILFPPSVLLTAPVLLVVSLVNYKTALSYRTQA